MIRKLLTLALASVTATALGSAIVRADELKIMSAGAVEGALRSLAADYTKANGTVVTFTIGNVGMIQDRLKAGDIADVVILSTAAIDALDKAGGLAAGSATNLGRIGMGVAIKAGAPKPDISTPAAFKAALQAVPSIAYSDPAGGGSSGIYFDSLIQRLGIADEIRKKAVLIRGGSAADRVASGEAAMAVQNISEVMHIAGVQLVGPFPAEDQNYLVYAAGVLARSTQPQKALAFIRYVTRPDAAERWKDAGVDPASGK